MREIEEMVEGKDNNMTHIGKPLQTYDDMVEETEQGIITSTALDGFIFS